MILLLAWFLLSAALITLWIWLSSPYDRGFYDGVLAEKLRAARERLVASGRLPPEPKERP
jgi:hypothetical protein